MTPRNVLLAMS